MQVEGMLELTSPLIDTDPAQLATPGSLTNGHLKPHPNFSFCTFENFERTACFALPCAAIKFTGSARR